VKAFLGLFGVLGIAIGGFGVLVGIAPVASGAVLTSGAICLSAAAILERLDLLSKTLDRR
jgi:hypothetical protein